MWMGSDLLPGNHAIGRLARQMDTIDHNGVDTSAERAEVHFLAALVDELMGRLQAAGALSKADLNAIEQAVAERVGGSPRAW